MDNITYPFTSVVSLLDCDEQWLLAKMIKHNVPNYIENGKLYLYTHSKEQMKILLQSLIETHELTLHKQSIALMEKYYLSLN